MVTFEDVRTYAREQVDFDKKRAYVYVSGATLEEALREAAVELRTPIKKLEYEVLDVGRQGVLGLGRRPCSLLAYPAKRPETAGEHEEEVPEVAVSETEPSDVDGKVFVRRSSEGILLKVTQPKGKGARVRERDALAQIGRYTDQKPDRSTVTEVVRRADGQYVKVAGYEHNPAADAALSVEVSNDEMKAFVTVLPPGPGGADISAEAVRQMLRTYGVVHGVKEDVLQALEDEPHYHEPVLVAEGTSPKDGADARIAYNFETDPNRVKLKEKDGRVDFKELNLVQNVVEGQVLAKKIPAERGQEGRTVTDKYLPAKDGKDVQMQVGKNAFLSEDGLTAVAEINGQVLLQAGKITVEPVYVVNGDVSLKTGNIMFLGAVIVKGSVEDGFSVKAAGNIEVMGSVGKCELEAEGDVIVHQGVAGKGEGTLSAGRGVWARFIENATVQAGTLVVVSDGIINSNVSADGKVICKGKRASIVGGHVRASEEVHAKTLGSVAGMETTLEVGYDPKSRQRLKEVKERISQLEKDLEEISLNLSTLQKLKQQKGSLPQEKAEFGKQLISKRTAAAKELKELQEEEKRIQDYLAELKTSGRISSSGTVYAGVRLRIKDAELAVRNEFKRVSFYAEGGAVKTGQYKEPEEDTSFGQRGRE